MQRQKRHKLEACDRTIVHNTYIFYYWFDCLHNYCVLWHIHCKNSTCFPNGYHPTVSWVTIRQEVQKCFSACGVYCSKRQYNIYIGSVPAHCSKNMNLIGYYYYSRIIANHSVWCQTFALKMTRISGMVVLDNFVNVHKSCLWLKVNIQRTQHKV